MQQNLGTELRNLRSAMLRENDSTVMHIYIYIYIVLLGACRGKWLRLRVDSKNEGLIDFI